RARHVVCLLGVSHCPAVLAAVKAGRARHARRKRGATRERARDGDCGCAWLRAVGRFAPPPLPLLRAAGARGRPARGAQGRTRSHSMLRIYPVILELVHLLRPLLKELERHDPDLARQCRRALTSVPLGVAEGSYSRGRNRAARYHTALGSLREVL